MSVFFSIMAFIGITVSIVGVSWAIARLISPNSQKAAAAKEDQAKLRAEANKAEKEKQAKQREERIALLRQYPISVQVTERDGRKTAFETALVKVLVGIGLMVVESDNSPLRLVGTAWVRTYESSNYDELSGGEYRYEVRERNCDCRLWWKRTNKSGVAETLAVGAAYQSGNLDDATVAKWIVNDLLAAADVIVANQEG